MPSALRKTIGDDKEDKTSAFYNKSPSAILRCDINEVFPIPEVILYRVGNADETNPSLLSLIDSPEEPSVSRNSKGAFNVKVKAIINDTELVQKFGSQPSIFECLVTLKLPNKILRREKKLTYQPGE